jgi:hypothetical protein
MPAGIGLPKDTDAVAYEVQRQIYSQLGGKGRLAIAFRLTDSVRRFALAGIRQRHPDYTEELVQQAFARLRLGDDLVRAIWPDRELVDP